MSRQYTYIILGGGAVGASAALALGQCNQRVLLIEKRALSTIRPTMSLEEKTLALSYSSVKIYEALGLSALIQENAIPIKKIHVSQQAQFGTCRMDHQKHNVDYLGVVVGAHDLEHALYEALARCPYVSVETYSSEVTPELYGDHWKVMGNEGKLLIAADGANSVFRDRAFIHCDEKEYPHCALSVNLRLQNIPAHLAVERFLEEGAIALLPWKQGWVTCVWTLDKEEALKMMALEEEAFKKACEKAMGKSYLPIEKIGKRMITPLKMKIAKNQFGARFLLLGNAAHSLHPIAAQGLNLSLRDIWQLRMQLQQDIFQKYEIGSQAFLEAYYRKRKAEQNRVIMITDGVANFMANANIPAYWRAMGMTLLDTFSFIKQPFVRQCMGVLA